MGSHSALNFKIEYQWREYDFWALASCELMSFITDRHT